MQTSPYRFHPSKSLIRSYVVRTYLVRSLTGALLTVTLLLVSGCQFGQAGQEADAAPVELDSYESPSAQGDSQGANQNTSQNTSQGSSDGGQAASAGAQDNSSTGNNNTGNNSQTAANDERQPILIETQGSYNGEIEPDETVAIMAEVAGKVLSVAVQEGDSVTAGQELVRLDGSILEGQQAQASAGLKAAQAQLKLLLVGADADNVNAAEAAVNAASVAYQEALKGAEAEDLTIAEAQLRQAQSAVKVAQAAFNLVKGNPQIGAMPQSRQLEQATLGLEAAQAQFQKVQNGSPAEAIAGAYAQLVQAQSQLANLKEGAKPEQIEAAQAQIEQAEAGLYLTALQAAKTSIAAPMDGIVTRKNVAVGSMAAPGSPLLEIMSNAVNITIPVEEGRMAQLAIGQSALIQVNAYPDQFFEGEIIRIAPQLDPSTRTVRVTIRPTNDTENRLVPGMFATVDLLN